MYKGYLASQAAKNAPKHIVPEVKGPQSTSDDAVKPAVVKPTGNR
jgi:hypothetical protein